MLIYEAKTHTKVFRSKENGDMALCTKTREEGAGASRRRARGRKNERNLRSSGNSREHLQSRGSPFCATALAPSVSRHGETGDQL